MISIAIVASPDDRVAREGIGRSLASAGLVLVETAAMARDPWVIVLWSEAAERSDLVRAEMEIAHARDRLVTVVVGTDASGCALRVPWPYSLGAMVDLSAWLGDEAAPEIAWLVSRLREITAPASSADRPR